MELPNELASVHPVFHVSILKKCIGNPESIIPIEGRGVKENLSYEEVPVQILDRQVKKLSNKEGATWEDEAIMKSRYPDFFDNLG